MTGAGGGGGGGGGGARVAVVGAGGNIGSHLVPHLARMGEVGTLVLIDRDRYEPRNRTNQAGARPGAKAVVQAKRARALNRRLTVVPVVDDVEQIPLGILRADLILACLDNRRARQWVNQAARRLGVPWIDGGVLADGPFARVTSFRVGADDPCLECGWEAADYRLLEQEYPCAAPGRAVPRTGASSALGALAAALQALECRRILSGGADRVGPSELVVDGHQWRAFATALRRNQDCRLGDHSPWRIEPLPGPLALPLNGAVELIEQRAGQEVTSVSVEGQRIVAAVACRRCGVVPRPAVLGRALRGVRGWCPHCGGRTTETGFGRQSALARSDWAGRAGRRTLRALGCRPGDVLSATGLSDTHYFEVAAQ